MTFANDGVLIWALLLLVVTACAFFLAFQAARNVDRFREDQHERFVRREPR